MPGWTPRGRWFVNISWRLANYPEGCTQAWGITLSQGHPRKEDGRNSSNRDFDWGQEVSLWKFCKEGATALFVGHKHGCSEERQGFLFADSAADTIPVELGRHGEPGWEW